jgi:hypothetical protein
MRRGARARPLEIIVLEFARGSSPLMVPATTGAYSIHSRDCYGRARALRSDVTVFPETRGSEFLENRFSTPGGPKRTSTTQEQIVDVFAGEVKKNTRTKISTAMKRF